MTLLGKLVIVSQVGLELFDWEIVLWIVDGEFRQVLEVYVLSVVEFYLFILLLLLVSFFLHEFLVLDVYQNAG